MGWNTVKGFGTSELQAANEKFRDERDAIQAKHDTLFVRLSALLLTIKEGGNDGYHHIVVTDNDGPVSEFNLGYVSTGQKNVPVNNSITIGATCAWSVNATDATVPVAKRGRDIKTGTVTSVGGKTVGITSDSGSYPSNEDIIYFNFI